MSFRVAGARDCGSCQKWAKHEGFVAFPKTKAGMGHLKRICKDACRVAGAVQKTCSWERLGGQGADFLRGFAFWSIRSVRLLRWFCVTGAALRMNWHQFFEVGRSTQYFRQVEWKNCKTHWYEAVSAALNFPFLKEASQNCFVFDVVKFKNWGSLAELLRFWCCQLWRMKKSRRIASFLTLSSSNIEKVSHTCCVFDVVNFEEWRSLAELLRFWHTCCVFDAVNYKTEEVSQNCFVFDVVKFKHWESLAHLLRFWCCQVQNLRTSRRIVVFSSLQIDR